MTKKILLTGGIIILFAGATTAVVLLIFPYKPKQLPKANDTGSISQGVQKVANSGAPGGCWGTSMIKDLKIEPKNSCLVIWANNCNGGVLEINNNCGQDVKIGNLNIPKSDRHGTYVIEFKKDWLGNITADEASGNFAAYAPSKDEEMLISGNIGKEKFTIYYLKKINQSRENMY